MTDDPKPKFVPSSFREARVALGMSQETFARAIGLSTNAVRNWEQGKAQPSPLSLNKVAQLKEQYLGQYDKHTARSRKA